jgi:hypothetical protein
MTVRLITYKEIPPAALGLLNGRGAEWAAARERLPRHPATCQLLVRIVGICCEDKRSDLPVILDANSDVVDL